MNIGVNPDFDSYFDDQQRIPVAFCPICKGEIYVFGGICLRCQRRAAADDGE